MTATEVERICGFDVAGQGTAQSVTDPWPEAAAPAGANYRWLHFDYESEGLEDWLSAHLPEIPMQALLQQETRPRCDPYEGGLILNLRGVNLNPGASRDDMVSVRLWVTEDLIVSARRRKVFAVDDLRQRMAQGHGPVTAMDFVLELAQGLVNRIEAFSHELDEETDRLEELVFENDDERSGGIAPLRLSVIRLRRFVASQRDALENLASPLNPMLRDSDTARAGEVANRAIRTVEELESARDRLTALQEYLSGQRHLAQAYNGYVLSVVAAIFLPLGFLTGLFGVNVGGIPGIGWSGAFYVLSGASVVIGIALFIYFRFSKWL